MKKFEEIEFYQTKDKITYLDTMDYDDSRFLICKYYTITPGKNNSLKTKLQYKTKINLFPDKIFQLESKVSF